MASGDERRFRIDCSSQVNGVKLVFNIGEFQAGSLECHLGGIDQAGTGFAIETDPVNGVVTLSVAPITPDNIPLIFRGRRP